MKRLPRQLAFWIALLGASLAIASHGTAQNQSAEPTPFMWGDNGDGLQDERGRFILDQTNRFLLSDAPTNILDEAEQLLFDENDQAICNR